MTYSDKNRIVFGVVIRTAAKDLDSDQQFLNLRVLARQLLDVR
jgi:hypothetical protein